MIESNVAMVHPLPRSRYCRRQSGTHEYDVGTLLQCVGVPVDLLSVKCKHLFTA